MTTTTATTTATATLYGRRNPVPLRRPRGASTTPTAGCGGRPSLSRAGAGGGCAAATRRGTAHSTRSGAATPASSVAGPVPRVSPPPTILHTATTDTFSKVWKL